MSRSSKEKILEAAFCLFAEQGIRKTTLDEVAERAGLSRMTVYRHFGDRDTLVEATVHHRLEQASLFRIDKQIGPTALTSVVQEQQSFWQLEDELARDFPALHRLVVKHQQEIARTQLARLKASLSQEYRPRNLNRDELLEAIFETLLRYLPEHSFIRQGNEHPELLLSAVADLMFFGYFASQSE